MTPRSKRRFAWGAAPLPGRFGGAPPAPLPAALGESQPEFDGLFGALAKEDAVGALRSLAELAREGWDPEQLAESFAGEVRQTFLLQVAPEVADAVDADRERLARWGEQLGLARTVRILETVG